MWSNFYYRQLKLYGTIRHIRPTFSEVAELYEASISADEEFMDGIFTFGGTFKPIFFILLVLIIVAAIAAALRRKRGHKVAIASEARGLARGTTLAKPAEAPVTV